MFQSEEQKFYNNVTAIFDQSQFSISTPLLGCGGCVDLIAKKQKILVLAKLLLTIDSFREEQAFELRKLAAMLVGFPLIISNKIRNNADIEEGVVYSRYEIPALSVDSLRNLLIHNIPPLIYASHGGFRVKFDGSLLKNIRLEKNYSLGDLAHLVGVSKRSIYEYEQGRVDLSLETALKIEEILDEPLTEAINLFEEIKQIGSLNAPATYENNPKSILEKELKNHFDNQGMEDQLWVKKMPIRVLAKAFSSEVKNKELPTTITSISEHSNDDDIKIKAQVTQNVSKLVNADPLVVVNKESKKITIDGVSVLSIKELLNAKKKR